MRLNIISIEDYAQGAISLAWLGWIRDKIESLLPRKVRVVKRYAFSKMVKPDKEFPQRGTNLEIKRNLALGEKGTSDSVDLVLEGLAIRVQREIRFNLPFEMTVIVPRAEVIKKYTDGKIVETKVIYSSITVAHSPRFPPRRP